MSPLYFYIFSHTYLNQKCLSSYMLGTHFLCIIINYAQKGNFNYFHAYFKVVCWFTREKKKKSNFSLTYIGKWQFVDFNFPFAKKFFYEFFWIFFHEKLFLWTFIHGNFFCRYIFFWKKILFQIFCSSENSFGKFFPQNFPLNSAFNDTI